MFVFGTETEPMKIEAIFWLVQFVKEALDLVCAP